MNERLETFPLLFCYYNNRQFWVLLVNSFCALLSILCVMHLSFGIFKLLMSALHYFKYCGPFSVQLH